MAKLNTPQNDHIIRHVPWAQDGFKVLVNGPGKGMWSLTQIYNLYVGEMARKGENPRRLRNFFNKYNSNELPTLFQLLLTDNALKRDVVYEAFQSSKLWSLNFERPFMWTYL